MQWRRLWLAFLVAAAGIAPAGRLHAQHWPQRPVKLIVPYAAGNLADEAGRVLAPRLAEVFGQPFIIENRPGASGLMAAEAVARAPADGHTLFLASLPQIAIMPAVMKTSFDPLRDMTPICLVITTPLALIVHPGLPVKTIADFVAHARNQAGQLTYAAVGAGGITHLAMTLFARRADVAMTPIMYKGGPAAISDVMAGHVKAHFGIAANVVPHAASGMVRLLAVSSAQRIADVPDIPTMVESGYPGFRMLSWTGLMAPAGTPKPVVDRIATEVSLALKDPVVAARLSTSGVGLVGGTPDDFAATIASDIPLWGEAVRLAGIAKSDR